MSDNFYPESGDNNSNEESSDSNKNKDKTKYKDTDYKINNFEELPKDLQAILKDLEENYEVINIKENWVYFNPTKFKNFITTILKNYSDYKKRFIKKYLYRIRTTTGISISNLNKNYEYYSPKEEVTITSTPKEKRDFQDKSDRGYRGEPHPLSSGEDVTTGATGSRDVWRRIPIDKVLSDIEGEIYKKNIYISKHNLDHFKSLEGRFDVAKNEIQRDLFTKIEENFAIEYSKYNTATPIKKEDQKALGICFTMQMTKKGYLKLHLKKYTDIQTFLEHFYRIFDFLTYEEQGEVLKELFLAKQKRKAFEYVHLANKVGPKPVIDEDFKGSHIIVKYATLTSGRKIINIKIDYSDPENPEIEFQGPEPQCRNLRDIIVGGSDLMPTFDNMATWSKEARNIASDNHFELSRIHQGLQNTGQVLLQSQKGIYDQGKKILYQNKDLMGELTKTEIQNELYYMDLKELSSKKLDTLTKLHSTTALLHNNDQLINQNLVDLGNLLNVIDKTRVKEHETLKESIQTNTEPIIEGLSNVSTKLDDLSKAMKEEFAEVKKVLQSELETFRTDYVNNLYLVLRKIAEVPELTSQELIKLLQEEIDLSQSTLYRYFRKLQEQEFITSEKADREGLGRKPRIFRITTKFKNILKNLKK